MKALSIIGVAVAWLALAATSRGERDVPPEYEPVLGFLKSQGVKEEEGRKFVDAIEKLETDGNVLPLRTYQAHQSEPLALFSGMYLALVEPKRTFRRAKTFIAKREGAVSAHLVTISLVPRKKSVDYLLKRWRETGDEDEIRTIKLGLRALTTEEHADREQWAAWWKANRKTVKLEPIADVSEALSRVQFAANMTVAGALKEALAGLEKGGKGEAVGEVLGDFFSRMEALNKLGMERENEIAERGDRLFREGRLAEAAEAYAQAVKAFPADHKSAFLLACLDLEADQFQAAEKRFREVGTNHPKAHAARLLAAYCAARRSDPKKPILKTLLEVAAASPAENLLDAWMEDVVMSRLIGQEMVKRGVLHHGSERLEELVVRHPEDLEVQIGVALLRGRPQQKEQLRGVLERFPGAPLALALVVQESWPSRPEKAEREQYAGLCRRWIGADPDNLLPRLLLLLTEQAKEIEGERRLTWKLPEAAWSELRQLTREHRPNNYHRERIEAQRRVSQLLGYPLAWNVEGPLSARHWFRLTRAARSRVEELHAKGDQEGLASLFELLDELCAAKLAASAIDLTTLAVCRSGPRTRLAELLRTAGREAEADEWQRAEDNARALRKRAFRALKILDPLAQLPVPSIQNEIRPLFLLDPARAVELVPAEKPKSGKP